MTREEIYTAIESFLSENKIGEKLIPRELVAELSERLAKLSLSPAEGAEAIVKKYEDEYDFKFHWVQRDRVIRMMREFAAQPQPKLDPKKVQWSGYGELGNISQKPLQPTAEGTGKTCHAKEMEYNHNMCAMQESCEKCEAYKVPTNEGDIAKTETDTGRIVDMPDLSQPTAEGAEEILRKNCNTCYSRSTGEEEVWSSVSSVLIAMQDFATLHAQRLAEKMVEKLTPSNEQPKDGRRGK